MNCSVVSPYRSRVWNSKVFKATDCRLRGQPCGLRLTRGSLSGVHKRHSYVTSNSISNNTHLQKPEDSTGPQADTAVIASDLGWGSSSQDGDWVEDNKGQQQQPDVWGTRDTRSPETYADVIEEASADVTEQQSQTHLLTKPITESQNTPSSSRPQSSEPFRSNEDSSSNQRQQPIQPAVASMPSSLLEESWGDDGQWDTSPSASWRTATPRLSETQQFPWADPVGLPGHLPTLPPFSHPGMEPDLFGRPVGQHPVGANDDTMLPPSWLDMRSTLNDGPASVAFMSEPSARPLDPLAARGEDDQAAGVAGWRIPESSMNGPAATAYPNALSEPGSSDWAAGLQPPWTIADARSSTSAPTAPPGSQPPPHTDMFGGSGASLATSAPPGAPTAPHAAGAGSLQPSPFSSELPAITPEPLLRAVEPGVLGMLSQDSSLPSLRERAQIAVRAASAAIEASQRAAAYSAAASSASSKAAEAAQRAALAATTAQGALDDASEGLMAAAESRATRAMEVAAEAEERAASAAAMATAYQDMAQTQAGIAETVANIPKPLPAPPPPLAEEPSWLQQAWQGVPGREQVEQAGQVVWRTLLAWLGHIVRLFQQTF